MTLLVGRDWRAGARANLVVQLARFFNPRRACAARVYGSRPVCVCVCQCLSSATHATTRPSRHTYGLSIVLAPEKIRRFSYNGYSAPILTVVGHFYTRNGLIFRIPSVYYARDFTRAVNLYAHV